MNRLAWVMMGMWLSAVVLAEPPRLTADANRAEDARAEQLQWQREQQRFGVIDRNGDGYISEQEAQQKERLLESWEKADLNADGRIDQTEFSAFETEEQPQ